MEYIGFAPEAGREIQWYIEAAVAETHNRITESFNLEKTFETIGSSQAIFSEFLTELMSNMKSALSQSDTARVSSKVLVC